MLLVANVGNSRISIGIFQETSADLLTKFQIATDIYKTSDEYSMLIRSMLRERGVHMDALTDAMISSVVPQLTETVKESITSFTGKTPLIVGPGVKTGFLIKIDTPSELGSDIVADVAAVLHGLQSEGKKTCAIIADLGTVTTISAVNRNGEFIGCSIFPGVRLSFEILHGKTAQLPNVMFSETDKVIGKNSQDAVRSGVLCGHAMMLDGFVRRFSKEMKCYPENVELFLTGENAKYMVGACQSPFVYDEDLTLKGLYYLFCNTVKN